MPWFKVDDNLAFHQKTLLAGNSAMGLWVRAGSWCAQQLTDGFVPHDMARTLGTKAEVQRLVKSRLWLEREGGYEFWQWTEEGRQPSRIEVEAKRRDARERQRRARMKASESRRDSERDDAVTHDSPDPTRPDPTLSTYEGGDRPETLRAVPATTPPKAGDDERCTRHPNGNPTNEPCQGCKRVEDRKARRVDREAEKARVVAEEAARNCGLCEGTHFVLDADKNPTRQKCVTHRRSA